MAAPTFVSSANTSTSGTTTPKTVTISVTAGDLIVVTAVGEDNTAAVLGTPTATGNTFTLRQLAAAVNYTRAGVWTATAASTNASLVVSQARTSGSGSYSSTVSVWRDHGGVGASTLANSNGGAPSLAITTTGANSAIVLCSGDWNAVDGASRTWRTAGVAATEQNYVRDAAAYSAYWGYHTDAGAAGAKTVGLSAPSGQKWCIVALEVLAGAASYVTTGAMPANVDLTAAASQPGFITSGSAPVDVALTATASTIATTTGALTVDVAMTATASNGAGNSYNAFAGTPQLASGEDTSAINVGTEFFVTATGWVTQVRFLQPVTGGSSTTRTAGIWSVTTGTTGTQVAGPFTLPTPTAGAWCTYTLPTPYQLTANQRYRVIVHHPAGDYCSSTNFFTSAPYNTGNYTQDGFFTVTNQANTTGAVQGSYKYGASAFTDDEFNNENYYADLTVSDTAPSASYVTTGALAVDVALTATTATIASSTGALAVDVALTAVASSGTATTGALGLDVALAATTSTKATSTGAVPVNLALTATASTKATSTGSLPVNLALAGVGSAAGATTGAVPVDVALTAAASTKATTTGAMTASVALTATTSTKAVSTGALGLNVGITGTTPGAYSFLGWPDSSNTGFSGALTPYVGDRVFTADNVVIENEDITGQITFQGSGCVLRNCRLNYNSFWPLRFEATTGDPGLVEDCTLIATANGQCSVYGDNVVIRRCDIYGAADGIKAGNNVTIEDNFIHDLAGGDPEFHHDGIDVEGNGPAIVRHNTVLVDFDETSCITVSRWTPTENIDNILVEGNLMAGAGYCIYGPGTGAPSPTNIVINRNVFSPLYYPAPDYGFFGWIAYDPPAGGGNFVQAVATEYNPFLTTASLAVSIDLSAVASQPGTATTGALGLGVGLTATTSTKATSTGALGVGVLLAGTASIVEVGITTGALGVGVALAGATSTKATSTGAVPVSIALAGTASHRYTATGAMTLSLALTAGASTRVVTTGELALSIGLAGATSATLSTTGALNVSIALAGVPLYADVAVTGSLVPRAYGGSLTTKRWTGALS